MLAQIALHLVVGETFTSNDGADWHTVHLKLIVRTNSGKEAILLMTEDHQKIWLWCDEEVVVRI